MLKKEESIDTTEKTVEGFEITEKAVELKKKDFFKMLAKAEEGLILTIERVGKIFISKYDSNKVGCFIDYSLGKPVIADYDSEGQPIYKVKITEGMNIFKILAVAVDLSKAKDITATEELIKNTLEGIIFKAEVGTAYNGGLLIEPTELL